MSEKDNTNENSESGRKMLSDIKAKREDPFYRAGESCRRADANARKCLDKAKQNDAIAETCLIKTNQCLEKDRPEAAEIEKLCNTAKAKLDESAKLRKAAEACKETSTGVKQEAKAFRQKEKGGEKGNTAKLEEATNKCDAASRSAEKLLSKGEETSSGKAYSHNKYNR